MARYFFHLLDGVNSLIDEEGSEFESEQDLFSAMLAGARDMMSGDVRAGRLNLGMCIEAIAADGTLVRRLPFKDALEICG